jgi:hypothetical protein
MPTLEVQGKDETILAEFALVAGARSVRLSPKDAIEKIPAGN